MFLSRCALLFALAFLVSCHRLTAPESIRGPRSAVSPVGVEGDSVDIPPWAVGTSRLVRISESSDSLRFALALPKEVRVQDWEGRILVSHDGPAAYEAFYPNGTGRNLWPIYKIFLGYGRERTGGFAVVRQHGALATIKLAWADIGGRRALTYWLRVEDDRGTPQATFTGTFTPGVVASRCPKQPGR